MPRKLLVDHRIPATPKRVEERLASATRFSLQPSRGGPITFGDRPLKGRVTEGAATVGLNRRDWWSMLQPRARVTWEATATGTRLQGEVGMPDWLTWLLRAVVVIGVPGATGIAVASLLADGSPGTTAIAVGFVLFSLVVSVLGVGAHVHHADAQVDALRDTLLQTAGWTGIPVDTTTAQLGEALREAEGGIRAGMDALRE